MNAIQHPLARKIAADALDKVTAATTPKLLVWDQGAKTLKAISSTTKGADKHIQNPLCLGQYDYGASLKDILEDLDEVLRQSG